MSKYLNCKNTSSSEREEIQDNFPELKTYISPQPTSEPSANWREKKSREQDIQKIFSIRTLLDNLAYPHLCKWDVTHFRGA